MKKYLLISLILFSKLSFSQVSDDSDYGQHNSNFAMRDAVNETLSQPRMILCFMSKLRPDLMVTPTGSDYLALVDQADCDQAGQVSSGPQASGGAASSSSNAQSSAISYTETIVNASRANDSAPMIVKAWIPEGSMGIPMTIYTITEATAGVSADAPFGEFTMRFTGTVDANNIDIFKGYLSASGSQLLFHEEFTDMDSGQTLTNKAVMNLGAGETGNGAVQGYQMDYDTGLVTTRVDVYAYNEEAFCRQKILQNGSETNSNEKCFSTDESEGTKQVFGYYLFDSETGDRYDLPNKGFRVKYNGQYGFADGYGVHFDDDTSAGLANGVTLTRDDDNASLNGQEYTTFFLGGKLIKRTVVKKSLASLDGLKFNAFFSSNNALGITSTGEYKLYYTASSDSFTITHLNTCGNTGCVDQLLDSEISFSSSDYTGNSANYGIFGYLPGIGGIGIGPDAMNNPTTELVTTEIERDVSPADYPATLYCVENCPTYTNIEAMKNAVADGDQPANNGPYSNHNSFGVSEANLVTYSLNSSTNVYGAGDGDAVYGVNLDSDLRTGLSNTQFGFGAFSGPLVTNADDLTCELAEYDYCTSPVWNGDISSYYVWVTSHQRWNQYRGLLDSTGKLVEFSPSEILYFNAPNDASKYGEFAGQELRLEFAGGDQIWGIPGGCVNDGTFVDDCIDNDSDSTTGYLPWYDKFRIRGNETTGRLYKNSGGTGEYYLVKPAYGEVILKRRNSLYRGTLTLGSADDLPSLEIVNVGPNGGDNYIGASPNKPSTVSIVHGLAASEAAAFAGDSATDDSAEVGANAPEFSSASSFTVAENSTSVGTLVASDPDGDAVVYDIGGFGASAFSVNSSTGALSFRTAPDYESKQSYSLIAIASDGVNSTTQALTVTVTNLNDLTPIITSPDTYNAAENQTSVGNVTATDGDGDTIAFSLTEDSTGMLEIDSSTGAITFSSAPDYESDPTIYTATVIASDGTNSSSNSITVNVTDVDENTAPSYTGATSYTAAENTNFAFEASFSDIDGDTLSFSIVGGDDQSIFSIDASSGEVTFNSPPNYENPSDANTDNSYVLSIGADDGTDITQQDVTVIVTNVAAFTVKGTLTRSLPNNGPASCSSDDTFGTSIDVDDNSADKLIVGCWRDDQNSSDVTGSVVIYDYNSSTENYEILTRYSNSQPNEGHGESVALLTNPGTGDVEIFAFGGQRDDQGGSNAGVTAMYPNPDICSAPSQSAWTFNRTYYQQGLSAGDRLGKKIDAWRPNSYEYIIASSASDGKYVRIDKQSITGTTCEASITENMRTYTTNATAWDIAIARNNGSIFMNFGTEGVWHGQYAASYSISPVQIDGTRTVDGKDSIAVSEDSRVLIVGDEANDRALMYYNDAADLAGPTNWQFVQAITCSTSYSDGCGGGVAVTQSGNSSYRIAIAVPGDDTVYSNAGSVHVFDWTSASAGAGVGGGSPSFNSVSNYEEVIYCQDVDLWCGGGTLGGGNKMMGNKLKFSTGGQFLVVAGAGKDNDQDGKVIVYELSGE